MEYGNLPVAKRTRSYMIARNLPVAKRTRSHMIARPCEKRKKAKLDGDVMVNEGNLKVKKERKVVKKNDEEEEVKAVCELVPDGSRFKVKGEGFHGEFVVTSKNVDVLQVVEQLRSSIRTMKGRFNDDGFDSNTINNEVKVEDVELDEECCEEEREKVREFREGEEKRREIIFVDSEEFSSSSEEEDERKKGVKIDNVGKKKVGDLKNVEVSESSFVDVGDSSSGEEGERRNEEMGNVRTLKRKLEKGNEKKVCKIRDGLLGDNISGDDTLFVDDKDDLQKFETRSFEEDVGKGGRKQVECVDVGEKNVGDLKRKMVAAEKPSSDSSDLEELELSSSEQDDDESNSEINRKKEEGDKGKTDGARVSGPKKRRVSELDILIDFNKNAEKPVTRLRSRSASKSENEKMNSRMASHTLPQDKDNYSCSRNVGDLEGIGVCKDGGRRKGKLGKPSGRKKSRASKNCDPLKILIDSIWKEGESPLEKFSASEENSHAKEELMYKFSLADQDVKLPHKPEWEEEIDFLFNQMQKYITCEEIGTSSLVDNENTAGLAETTPVAICSRGHHQLRLDEQVGLICACCSYVDLEIKYILPPFDKYPIGRPRNNFYGTEEWLYPDFQFQDSAAEGLYDFEGSNHTEGTVWDLVPGTRRSMYEHQREGFEFLWKNVVGGICIEKLENPLSNGGGGGCIISHAPGTGKTRLSIVFLQSFMKMYPKSRPVIIAPKSMLLTWEEEFKKWKVDVPFHNMNNVELSGKENAAAVGLLKINRQAVKYKKATRIIKLNSWSKGGSVLGISYRLFEKLAGGREKPKEEKSVGNALLQLSSLVVLDEGHTPRNEQTLIWKALHKVETQRRIILSGTPFQNNFSELYNTLCLVNPTFADPLSGHNSSLKRDHKEIRKASKSKWASMTNSIGDSKRKLSELKDKINPFVHIHKGTILQEKLPGLRHALILLRPTEMQKSLFGLLRDEEDGMSYLDFSRLVTLVSVHPSLLLLPDCAKLQSCVDFTEFSAHTAKLETLKMDPYAGVKTKFVIELARLCETWDEKVLVFSQYLSPLDIIKKQLEAYFRWNEGKEILYMDGSLDAKLRQSSIASLNDPNSNVRVLLASTKACSEGINLVGASRVVLLDVVWNPSVERQAISRAYRIGQRKMVYIYHLIAGKIEVERYERQIEKDRLSEMVFSSKSIDGCKDKISSTVTEDSVLEAMVQCDDKLGNMFQKIIYQPKESDLVGTYDLVDNI